MRHVDPSRLFARAEGRTEFDEQEREHVDKCEDCKQMFEVFSGFLIDDQKGDQSLRSNQLVYFVQKRETGVP